MRSRRISWMMVLLAAAFGAAALLLPLEVVEILGAPLVVAGAYYLGLRGGFVLALWATFVATVAFLIVHDGDLEDYIVTVTGYLIIGVLVGLAVDRFARQRRRLEEAAESAELAQKQFAASEGRYRLLFEQSADPVYLHGLDAAGEPTRFIAVNDASLRAARLHQGGAARPHAAGRRRGAQARPAAAQDGGPAQGGHGPLRERAARPRPGSSSPSRSARASRRWAATSWCSPSRATSASACARSTGSRS